jgi:hypothetical protein
VFCAGAQSGNTVTKLLGRHVKTVTPMVAGNVATELFGFSGVLLCPHGLPQKLLYILLALFFFLCVQFLCILLVPQAQIARYLICRKKLQKLDASLSLYAVVDLIYL